MDAEVLFLTLENLGQGAAAELFESELNKVLTNIIDPNTKAEAPRAITLKVMFKPDEKREKVEMEISCDASIAKQKGYKTTAFIGRDAGKMVALEYDAAQHQMFSKARGNVTEMAKAGGE